MVKGKKYPGDKQFFIDIGIKHRGQDLYDFIFGKKRSELGTVLHGCDKLIASAESSRERWKYALIKSVLEDAHKNEVLRLESRFLKRFGKTSVDAADQAKKGDDKCLMNLIAFNKLVLFEDWVKERVLRAEAEQDVRFLKALGSAVGQVSAPIEDFSGRENEKQRNLRRLLRVFSMFKYDFNKKDAEKEIFEIIEAINASDPKEGLPYIEHIGVIKKTIMRMGLKM